MDKPNRTTRHEFSFSCPFCHAQFDATTSLTDPNGTPEAGDTTICIQCGEVSLFELKPLRLRKPTDKEYLELGADENIKRSRKVWVDLQAARKREAEKTINQFPPFSDDFDDAKDVFIGAGTNKTVEALLALFFYTGAMAFALRVVKLKGGYSDFMIAVNRFRQELEVAIKQASADAQDDEQ